MSRLACPLGDGFFWETGPGEAPNCVLLDDQEFPNGWTLVAPKGWSLRQADGRYRLEGPAGESLRVPDANKALTALDLFAHMPAGWTIDVSDDELVFKLVPRLAEETVGS